MTPARFAVLMRAAERHPILAGTALNLELSYGTMGQVRWLLKQRLCFQQHGRLIATPRGRAVFDLELKRRSIAAA